MSTQIRRPDHHFRAYFTDNSLLIQFMSVEFVHTVQLALKLNSLLQKHFCSNKPSLTGLPDLKAILEQLIRYHPQQEPSSSSRWTKGALTKLKDYCQIFSSNSSHQNKQQINLHMAAHQALLNAIHAQELLNSLTVNPYIPNSGTMLNLLPIRRTCDAFQCRINQVIRYFPSVLDPFWNNENVLLCILRIRQSLIEIYGANFIDKRFKCPVKSKELFQFLSERYRVRGFDSLLPIIQQYYEADKG